MICPLCGSGATGSIAFRRDDEIEAWRSEVGDQRPYTWALCRRCGNAFPSVQPDMRVLRRVWETNRSVDELDPKQAEAAWTHRRRISQIGADRSYRLFAPLARRKGRFMDVACGLGETVRVFADQGWEAEGVDADPSVETLHRQLGIRTQIGPFEQIKLQDGYEMIHIAHAIYFITDPMGFLRGVRDHLAPDGLFGVVLSDFMSSMQDGQPSYAHTFLPTAASMRYLLALAGFESVLARRMSGSIYLAARPTDNPALPRVHPFMIELGYRTRTMRYEMIGKPALALRRLAKTATGRN